MIHILVFPPILSLFLCNITVPATIICKSATVYIVARTNILRDIIVDESIKITRVESKKKGGTVKMSAFGDKSDRF